VCNNSPAEWFSPEKGWRFTVLPMHLRFFFDCKKNV